MVTKTTLHCKTFPNFQGDLNLRRKKRRPLTKRLKAFYCYHNLPKLWKMLAWYHGVLQILITPLLIVNLKIRKKWLFRQKVHVVHQTQFVKLMRLTEFVIQSVMKMILVRVLIWRSIFMNLLDKVPTAVTKSYVKR